MSTLTDIATEAFFARLLPLKQEIILPAMHAFGEPPAVAMAAAMGGALAAYTVLYLLGIWLRRLPKKISTEDQQARIEKLRAAARQWLPWLLIFAPTPVGNILVIAAGFFALRPLLSAAAIVAGELLWRVSPFL